VTILNTDVSKNYVFFSEDMNDQQHNCEDIKYVKLQLQILSQTGMINVVIEWLLR
jgi:hypothetical protein